MSDLPEAPGWWIASDGNWYPPELHPSVREGSRMRSPLDTPVQPATPAAGGGSTSPGPHRTPATDANVGPQFPDLYQEALQGSHLADNITVRNGLDDGGSPGPLAGTRSGGTPRGGTPVAVSSGGSNRRRWRRGR
jgi:hypothetical protein